MKGHKINNCMVLGVLLLTLILGQKISTSVQSIGTSRDYWPTSGWQTATPEAQGMDSLALEQMMMFIADQQLAIDSVLVVKNGYLVLEEYPNPEYSQHSPHLLYSVTKSVTSALVGIAIKEGFIESIDQKVVDFFPEKTIANLDARKQRMTLEHLLAMTSGFEWEGPDDWSHSWGEALRSGNPIQFVLDQPMANDPGVEWVYNGGCSHLLSAIIQKTTGYTTLDFAHEFLFEPLGISDVRWPIDPQGVYFGGQDIWLKPRDMAKFGYLYLNNGMWEGETIIPADWVARSTNTSTWYANNGGYGWQWWTFPQSGVYYASGGFQGEQKIYVVPEMDLVVVFTASIKEWPNPEDGMLAQFIMLVAIANSTSNPGVDIFMIFALISLIAPAVVAAIYWLGKTKQFEQR